MSTTEATPNQFTTRGTIFSGLGRRLFVLFLLISLIPLTVVSWISYRNVHKTLQQGAVQSMTATVQLKKKYFQTFFTERLNDLRMQATLTTNIDLLEELRQNLDAAARPAKEFVSSFDWVLVATDAGSDLANFKQAQGYDDIQLIDLEGNILYSAGMGPELGENIFSSATAGSKFAGTCRKALASPDRSFVSDMEFYDPTDERPELFLVQAVKNEFGDSIGLMVLRMSGNSINEIMQEHTGLGESGETYLLGDDLLLRSSSRFDPQSTALKRAVEMAWIFAHTEHTADDSHEKKVEDQWKSRVYTNYRDTEVLGVHSHLESLVPLGLSWTIIAEIPITEAHQAADILRNIMLALVSITAGLVILLASAATRRIVIPVLALSDWAKQVAIGNLNPKEIPRTKHELAELEASFKQVVDSLTKVTEVCKSIAIGESVHSIPIRSDHDQLGRAVNQMADNLNSVVRQADNVAHGDYTTEIVPRSDKDKLGRALFDMTNTLSRLEGERAQQLWLQKGLRELNERFYGEHDIKTLCHNILSALADILKVQIATISLVDRDTLKLRGAYAFEETINTTHTFRIGEGLIGQAARDGKILTITDIPPDYIKISSVLGESLPTNVIIVPFFFENRIKGVMEFGSFAEFTDRQIEFLEMASENIGIAINTTEARLETIALLEQTTRQAEELQAQQEELRQTNEELEEQTRALKSSEERLQTQQEELRVSNEELEERTTALQERGNAIMEKNRELQNAHREIEQKAEALEKAGRYKSDFLANMSHELRTPLNSILILSQLLSQNKGNNLSKKQLEYAQTIHTSGSDLLQLINEVLDLSKVEAGRMEVTVEKIQLDELVDTVVRGFKQLAQEKGIQFKVQLTRELPQTISSDRQRLHQIIKNLVANAFKFTEKGSVSLRVFQPDPGTVFHRSPLRAEEVIAFAVTDTGVGIHPAKHDIIFKAFYQADGTTSRKFGGTGLGLSISRRLAKLLGGEIQLTSEEGKGSTFTLYLPRELQPQKESGPASPEPETEEKTAAPAETVSDHPAEISRPPLEKPVNAEERIKDDRHSLGRADRTLLVIEDDPSFAQILLDLSREKGYKCLVANDGETGLHFADYYRPSAIILDVGLPGIDGREVLARLKENRNTRHIPVHFISSNDESLEAMRMGAIGYLTKPASMENLDKAFKKISDLLAKPMKKLLVVEDDEIQQLSIVELIGNSDVQTTAVGSGEEAYQLLRSEPFDCMILDLGLRDMTGFDLLARIRKDDRISRIPIVIYTARELTREEETELQKYAESIIVKGVRSPERLLAETTLFLHRVEENLPESQRQMLKMVQDKESVLAGRKVLVVDDDMRNVFALSSVLEDKGIEVIAARNGLESLDKLNENPDIDLVLMDIMMPEMDGYQAIGEIRKKPQFYSLPIIALTAKAMKGDRGKCIEAGANDYLAKPFDTDKLLSLLRVWLYR